MATEFIKLDVHSLVPKPCKTWQGRKTVWIDPRVKDGDMLVTPENMRQVFAVRPRLDATMADLGAKERLDLQVAVTKLHVELVAKAGELDNMLIEHALKNKRDIFGASCTATSAEGMRGLYKPIVRAGGESEDGTVRYDDSMRFKVDGWSTYIADLSYREKNKNGQVTRFVSGATWRDRLWGAPDDALAPRDTVFKLFLSRDEDRGEDRYTDKVPVLDAEGNPAVDTTGKTVWRRVGPQDCDRDCLLKVVFRVPKVTVTTILIPTCEARVVYIKPAPKASDAAMDNAHTVDDVDEEEAMRALRASRQGGGAGAGSGGGGAFESGSKRTAEDGGGGGGDDEEPEHKKSRTVLVDDF